MPVRRVAAMVAAVASCCASAPVASAQAVPVLDDPLLAQTWQLASDGPLGARAAWEQSTGRGALVAVLDSGADLAHPDLAPALWTNPGERPGNRVDDDGDGVVDDVHGADFVNGDGDPADDNGHGTHVAGIIGAQGANAIGSTGMAWDARIIVVKVLDARATGRPGTVARGLRYAVAHGARVVNLSLAGGSPSRALRSAIDEAEAAGVLVVAAAGNDGRNLTGAPTYPLNFPQANVLGVTATDRVGGRASMANWGPGVELSAPGVDVLSTARGGGYELRSGTSVAAPMVTAAAALVASVHRGATWRELRAALLWSARPGAGPGMGRALDVAGALRAAPGAVRAIAASAAQRAVARRPSATRGR